MRDDQKGQEGGAGGRGCPTTSAQRSTFSKVGDEAARHKAQDTRIAVQGRAATPHWQSQSTNNHTFWAMTVKQPCRTWTTLGVILSEYVFTSANNWSRFFSASPLCPKSQSGMRGCDG